MNTIVAAVLSVLPIIVAIVFGTLTIRQWQRTRYLQAAAELVHTIQTPEFVQAIAAVLELPVEATREDIESRRDVVSAVNVIVHGFESLGVLVYSRLLPLHLVDGLVGGYLRVSWKRLRPFMEAKRAQVGPMFGEWFQWLAERMEEDPAPGKEQGAYVAHRHWRR